MGTSWIEIYNFRPVRHLVLEVGETMASMGTYSIGMAAVLDALRIGLAKSL